jgi:hypothetical protein
MPSALKGRREWNLIQNDIVFVTMQTIRIFRISMTILISVGCETGGRSWFDWVMKRSNQGSPPARIWKLFAALQNIGQQIIK